MGSENILPGISLKDENKQLENSIDIAQENLDNARRSVEKLNEDLSDLREVYDAQDKEGLVWWNNAAAQLEENKRNVLRCEKARKKPYFGRIDFKDPKQKDEEVYYIGRVGIAKNASEPVVIISPPSEWYIFTISRQGLGFLSPYLSPAVLISMPLPLSIRSLRIVSK